MAESPLVGEGQEREDRRIRVLVIDDSEDSTEMFATLLARAGYEVETAESAPAALEVSERGTFDLIISDIGMPGMSGYQLAKQLRSLPEYRNVPMLAITGFAEFANRQTAVWAGFDEYLHKPIDPAKLLEVVARLVGERK